MAVVKVIEILAQSNKSWEDAAQSALAEVTKTVRGVQSIYIKELQATVENGRIAQYRINAKISFLINEREGKTNREKSLNRPAAAKPANFQR